MTQWVKTLAVKLKNLSLKFTWWKEKSEFYRSKCILLKKFVRGLARWLGR